MEKSSLSLRRNEVYVAASGLYRFTTSMGSTFVAACAGIQLAIDATREQAIHLELRRELKPKGWQANSRRGLRELAFGTF